MRADRLISILLLLQNCEKMTAKELAEELEVTERTIHRDMEALSAAGIPVVADRGKMGGWRLLEQYRTNLTGLKANEIKSLFITPSFQLLDDLGFTDNWKEARQKLMASIPTPMRINAADAWNRIHVDTSRWRQAPEKVETFVTLKQAIWGDKKLQIEYQRADGELLNRTVEPLGLVAKGSTWYLIARSDEKIRNYRASRILAASLVEEPFIRPKDFNLEDYWQESTQSFVESMPTYSVEVEISPLIMNRIRFTGRFVQVIHVEEKTANGWYPATLRFETEQEATEYILGFGNQIKIIHPTSLQEAIKEMAKKVIEFYSQGGDKEGDSSPAD
ncbi:helix-turn-helix transcriptional regulator [Neobacillus sp. Marseille-QA0830]